MVRFVWDERKNRINQGKHGVSFADAAKVFNDPNALLLYDSYHSVVEEERFRIIAMARSRILVVCYCYVEEGEDIRIISARKAGRHEIEQYFGNQGYKSSHKA